MAYSGRYKPDHPKKYKGDYSNVIFRSLWELKFMKWCDGNKNVIEWGSEEIVIPYRSPIDNKMHRYFPDFYVKVNTKERIVRKYIIEIKPLKQTKPPIKPKRTRVPERFLAESITYQVNEAKWKAAIEFCNDNRCHFRILTEKELNI